MDERAGEDLLPRLVRDADVGLRRMIQRSACGCLYMVCVPPEMVMMCAAHYDDEVTTRAQLARILRAPTWNQRGPAREVRA